jgi:hypothetical protein
VQPVCIVVPKVVGDLETFHQCNALSEYLPPVILVKGLFMLVGIRSEFFDEDHVWFEDRWMVASLCDE